MPADTGLRAVFARTFAHPVRAEPVPFNPSVLLGAAVLTLILIPLFGVVRSILTCGKIAWVPPLCSAGALLAVSVFLAWMAMLPGLVLGAILLAGGVSGWLLIAGLGLGNGALLTLMLARQLDALVFVGAGIGIVYAVHFRLVVEMFRPDDGWWSRSR